MAIKWRRKVRAQRRTVLTKVCVLDVLGSICFAHSYGQAIWPADVEPRGTDDPFDVNPDSVILDNVSQFHKPNREMCCT